MLMVRLLPVDAVGSSPVALTAKLLPVPCATVHSMVVLDIPFSIVDCLLWSVTEPVFDMMSARLHMPVSDTIDTNHAPSAGGAEDEPHPDRRARAAAEEARKAKRMGRSLRGSRSSSVLSNEAPANQIGRRVRSTWGRAFTPLRAAPHPGAYRSSPTNASASTRALAMRAAASGASARRSAPLARGESPAARSQRSSASPRSPISRSIAAELRADDSGAPPVARK